MCLFFLNLVFHCTLQPQDGLNMTAELEKNNQKGTLFCIQACFLPKCIACGLVLKNGEDIWKFRQMWVVGLQKKKSSIFSRQTDAGQKKKPSFINRTPGKPNHNHFKFIKFEYSSSKHQVNNGSHESLQSWNTEGACY